MAIRGVATLLLALILLLPTALAWWLYPLPLADAGSYLQAAGRLAGVLGLTCLLLNAALSVRLPGFDRLFGGLTKLWKLHHKIGAASFVLLMLHPLLLAYGALPVSTAAAAAILWPPADQPWLWVGWLALLCMMVFLAPSFGFFGRPHYQRWKGLHLLAGAALLLGLAHALPLTRALPPAWAWATWGLLGSIALAAFAYRVLLSRRLARLPYRVTAVTPLADGVVELSLAASSQRRLRYRAGQFVYFAHLAPELGVGYNEQHPFTLSSAPQEEELRLGIKNLGDLSAALQRIPIGATVSIEGPYGDFFNSESEAKPQLWLAGGIGITPFVGRARTLLLHGGAAAPTLLVYCAENPHRSYYLDELRQIAAATPGFAVDSHLFERDGVLTAQYLDSLCPDWRSREIFLCGPPGMLSHCSRLLRAARVRRVHTEEFDLL